MISVILSEEIHRKSLGGSTLGSVLNAQRKIILEIMGNQEEIQKGRDLN